MGMSADPILFFGIVFSNGHEFRPGEDFDSWDFNQDDYPVEIISVGHCEYSYPALAVKESVISHYDYLQAVDPADIRRIGDLNMSSMTVTLLQFAREHKLNIVDWDTHIEGTIGPDWILAANWG